MPRKLLLAIPVAVVVAGVAVLLLQDRDSEGDEASGSAGSDSKALVTQGNQPAEITLMPVAAEAARIGSEETDISEDVEIVGGVIEFYRRLYDQNPVGLNHEIVKALAGKNQKGAAFLSPDHPAINEKGELTDRWGTPFFFHQLSASEMEVISAGPDKQLWTADDVKSG